MGKLKGVVFREEEIRKVEENGNVDDVREGGIR